MKIKVKRKKLLIYIIIIFYFVMVIIVMKYILGESVDNYEKGAKELCKDVLKNYDGQFRKYRLSAFDSVIGIEFIFDDRVNGEVTRTFKTDEIKTAYHVFLDIIDWLNKPKYQHIGENTESFYVRVKKREQHDTYTEISLNYDCGKDTVYAKSLCAASTCRWVDLGIFIEINQVDYLGAIDDISVFSNYKDLKNLILNDGNSFTVDEQLKITQQIKAMFPACKVEWRGVSQEE